MGPNHFIDVNNLPTWNWVFKTIFWERMNIISAREYITFRIYKSGFTITCVTLWIRKLKWNECQQLKDTEAAANKQNSTELHNGEALDLKSQLQYMDNIRSTFMPEIANFYSGSKKR